MRTQLLCMVIALTAVLPAQDLGHKSTPQRYPVRIEHATIHTISGATIENGAILFAGGTIRAVGNDSDVPTPDNAQRLDASGKHVYPGMIVALSTIGLAEISSVPGTLDANEIGEITPEVRACVAVNPDSVVIPVTRSNGVLAAGTFPSGGLIPGRASVIWLEGWTWDEMTVAADAGLVVNWPSRQARRRRFGRGAPTDDDDPAKRADERREQISAALTDARAHLAARAADPSISVDLRHLALRAVLAGERPVFVHADDVEQIESAVLWGKRLGVRVVIVGGRDADRCTALLADHDVAVIVRGTHRLPRRRDSPFDEPFSLPWILQDASVRWCMAGDGGFYNERNLPYHLATAVAFGLDHTAAMRAVTLSAAEILGVEDRLGSLDVGKSATLIVTDGDPLEMTTHIDHAFINGRTIDLGNKHTRLAEKYRQKYRSMGLWPVDEKK